ncbi:hypothetical protein [Rhizobium laguerreae]|uniref:hypothetical protein n=1 Tax=Rhizobium laguerreae TaxID=1076926 RepID=UPI001C9152F3|nr:hypothetical protein [Rhizobium laguerreae]MBY3378927.1 hypothetical protein [Rhizobium laguerreae]
MPVLNSVSLGDVSGVDAFDVGLSAGLGAVQMVTPPATGVTATDPPIAPVAAAGVALSKFVLWIVTFTILFFGVYLFVVDVIYRLNMGDTYEHVYMQIESDAEFIDTTGISALVDRFANADPNFVLATTEVDALNVFMGSARNSKIISDRQLESLKSCLKEKDVSKLPACGDMLGTALKAATAGSFNLEKVRALNDFVKTVDDQQKSFQSFWLQVAQLILLNLLLPLLTGLFGYIFGTTQATPQSKE